jgi:hypothetical protein
VRIDVPASTVTLDGRRFPAALVICPPTDADPDEPEVDRVLGAPVNSGMETWVPLENGLLVSVQEHERRGLELALYCRTCEWEDAVWLPHDVGLVGDEFVEGAFSVWTGCDEDWAVEHILRLAGKPLRQPAGPPVKLVPLHWRGAEVKV